jgi:hypothetical protein
MGVGARGVLGAAAMLLVGAVPASAVEPPAELATIQVVHEGASSELEVCVWRDGDQARPADAVLDGVRRLWPAVAELDAEESFDCWYLKLPDVRTDLETGDGFVAEVTIPPLASLVTASMDVEVAVCTVAIEVTTEVAPAAAARDDRCGYGYLGVDLDPSVASTVTVVARASDAFLLQRSMAMLALIGLVAVVAFTVSAAFRRRLAVRSAGASTWQVWTWPVLIGVAAAIAVVIAAWGLGTLDAWVVRGSMALSVVVAIAAGLVTLAAVLAAARPIASLRHDPGVHEEARRRGHVEPTIADVPDDLRDLSPPAPLLVPAAPWWAAAVRAAPGGLLWCSGLAGLWLVEPGTLPTLALAGAVVGAAATWLLPSLVRIGLDPQRPSVERERALLAALRRLGLPMATVLRSSVQLPEDDLGPAPAMVVGRALVLSPALDRCDPDRAALLVVSNAAAPSGLAPAWFGAIALIGGAFLDGAFGALTVWTLLPAALLVVPTLRWLRTRRAVQHAARSLDPVEVVDASVEVAWLTLRQLAVDDTAARLDHAGLSGSSRYRGKLDDTTGERVLVEGNREQLAVAWPLLVAAIRDEEIELGAPPGTAEAAARRLS